MLGATGTIGALMSAELQHRGHDVVSVHRGMGIDVAEIAAREDQDQQQVSSALTQILAGCDAAVDCLNLMTLHPARARRFFTRTARAIAASARTARLPRLLVISIAEADQPAVGRGYPYYAAKAAQERAYSSALAGAIPLTVVRSTQWFELVPMMVSMARAGSVSVLPQMQVAAVAAQSVARIVVEDLESYAGRPSTAPRTMTIRGPDESTVLQLAKAMAARGLLGEEPPRWLFHAPYLGPAIASGGLIPQVSIVDEVTLPMWMDQAAS